MTDTQSWDAFWQEVSADADTEVICGVTVNVPTDITLGFDQQVLALQDSGRDDDVLELVGALFGRGVLEQWIANGMTIRQFQVVFAWGYAAAKGKRLTFREAYEAMTHADPPAAANRAQRRAAQTKPSAAGGGPSKRTSSASTGSARRRSRR